MEPKPQSKNMQQLHAWLKKENYEYVDNIDDMYFGYFAATYGAQLEIWLSSSLDDPGNTRARITIKRLSVGSTREQIKFDGYAKPSEVLALLQMILKHIVL